MIRHASSSTVASCTALFALAITSTGCAGDPNSTSQPVDAVHFDYPLDDVLRLHHVQMKTTHNSYHVANPELSDPEYSVTQAPLDVQLGEQGARGLELDFRRDLDNGGFQVFHIPLLDEGTTCPTLANCLGVIKAWSDAHRAHHPITIKLDIKDIAPGPDEIEDYFAELHAEIFAVWPKERVITPDEVQGAYPTLGEAIRTEGWPVLGKLRGRVMFTLYNYTDDFATVYSRNGTSLAGRVIFTRTVPGDPIAATTQYDNAVTNAQAVAAALSANMLVLSHPEMDLVMPTTELRDATLASGVQYVATDFPVLSEGKTYWVDIPGGTPSRCNPITAPPECTPEAIEDPSFVGP